MIKSVVNHVKLIRDTEQMLEIVTQFVRKCWNGEIYFLSPGASCLPFCWRFLTWMTRASGGTHYLIICSHNAQLVL